MVRIQKFIIRKYSSFSTQILGLRRLWARTATRYSPAPSGLFKLRPRKALLTLGTDRLSVLLGEPVALLPHRVFCKNVLISLAGLRE